MKIKRHFLLVLAFISAFIITGCGNNETDSGIKIVCTSFPQYDWAKQICKDVENVDIKLLTDNGVDLHNYQPTAKDIIDIKESDLFIYEGVQTDSWVEDVLIDKEENQCINMIDSIGDRALEVCAEEFTDGHQLDETSEKEHDLHSENLEEHNHHHSLDEHVWMSLTNADIICKEISKKLCSLDKDNKDIYTNNENQYSKQLNDLNEQYENTVKNSLRNKILVGDRFPYAYLFKDYNLDYLAAFSGCGAESEASFETIAYLSKELDKEDLPAVIVSETSDKKVAESIIDNSNDKNKKIFVLNSIQSISKSDIQNNVSYYSIMNNN